MIKNYCSVIGWIWYRHICIVRIVPDVEVYPYGHLCRCQRICYRTCMVCVSPRFLLTKRKLSNL